MKRYLLFLAFLNCAVMAIKPEYNQLPVTQFIDIPNPIQVPLQQAMQLNVQPNRANHHKKYLYGIGLGLFSTFLMYKSMDQRLKDISPQLTVGGLFFFTGSICLVFDVT